MSKCAYSYISQNYVNLNTFGFNYTESDIEGIYRWNNVKITGNEQIHFNLVRFK
jgi:hypothetical protein